MTTYSVMTSEYQRSLITWVKGLTTSQLAQYMENLEGFNDAEVDALINEDIRRILTSTL